MLETFTKIKTSKITAGLIIAQTAAYFGLAIDELTGPSRGRHLVMARQIAMYLCRELTELSLPKIGGRSCARRVDVAMARRLATRQLDRFQSTSNFAAHMVNNRGSGR